MQALLERGYSVSRVLPGQRLADHGHSQLIVLGQFGDAVPQTVAADATDAKLELREITGLAPDAVVGLVAELCTLTRGGTAAGWKPWFPVIDYDRCTNCMQCLSFCLFDVYGATADGKIKVQNENNCKTDCPACSRVCPEVAILFPKYKAGPINGDIVNQDDIRREAMKVDISALLGGDIYALLRDRSEKAKSRFSKERDDERALKERQRCLQKLKDAELDVPAEVLASLPSFDQIQEKAREAKQRAQAALDRQRENAVP
jgi:NAD-dependent dihydropyrimidine dehydrogenase PreA subunit